MNQIYLQEQTKNQYYIKNYVFFSRKWIRPVTAITRRFIWMLLLVLMIYKVFQNICLSNISHVCLYVRGGFNGYGWNVWCRPWCIFLSKLMWAIGNLIPIFLKNVLEIYIAVLRRKTFGSKKYVFWFYE